MNSSSKPYPKNPESFRKSIKLEKQQQYTHTQFGSSRVIHKVSTCFLPTKNVDKPAIKQYNGESPVDKPMCFPLGASRCASSVRGLLGPMAYPQRCSHSTTFEKWTRGFLKVWINMSIYSIMYNTYLLYVRVLELNHIHKSTHTQTAVYFIHSVVNLLSLTSSHHHWLLPKWVRHVPAPRHRPCSARSHTADPPC